MRRVVVRDVFARLASRKAARSVVAPSKRWLQSSSYCLSMNAKT
jgi:hypothetical protein